MPPMKLPTLLSRRFRFEFVIGLAPLTAALDPKAVESCRGKLGLLASMLVDLEFWGARCDAVEGPACCNADVRLED